MYGLIDDMCELRETIHTLKTEKRALIESGISSNGRSGVESS
jgi:hypothetical protein